MAQGLKTVFLDPGMNRNIQCAPASITDAQVPFAEATHSHDRVAARTADANRIVIAPPPAKEPMARYYSHALSAEDKHALVVGEENLNLQKWTYDRVLPFHDSRLALIHPGPEGQKDMIEKLMDERQKSEIALEETKKKGPVRTLLLRTLSFGNVARPSNANLKQVYQPYRNVRHSTAPGTPGAVSSPSVQTSPQTSPPISPRVSLMPEFSISTPALIFSGPSAEKCEAGDDAQVTAVPERTEDNVTHLGVQPIPRRPQSHPPHALISGANRVSAYIGSPLNPRLIPYRAPSHQARPNVTFDEFLVPHASGKGETYRGLENAKDYTPQSGAGSLHVKERKGLLKKMSLPIMRRTTGDSKWSLKTKTSQDCLR